MKLVGKIVSLVIWVAILGWVGIIAYDYFNVTKEKEPHFCLEKGTTKYSDGTVDWCKGLGYKAFRYNRTNFNYTYEFGPFWIDDRTADTK